MKRHLAQTTRIGRMLILLCCLCLTSGGVAGQTFSGGDGSLGNPYLIANVADLLKLSKMMTTEGAEQEQVHDKHFLQTADFSVPVAAELGGQQWIAIGAKYPFMGTYDGGGHSIDSLRINYSEMDLTHFGLFGQLSGATVKNVVLTVPEIKFDNLAVSVSAGFIAGSIIENSTIENCTVRNGIALITMTSGDIHLGGILGNAASSGAINGCDVTGYTLDGYNTGSGSVYLGGIAGQISGSSSIQDSRSFCDLTSKVTDGNASNHIGGIVGQSGGVNSCSAHGRVYGIGLNNAKVYLGGIVGSVGVSGGSISYCTSYCSEVGGITAGTGFVGRIAGNSISEVEISYLLYNKAANMKVLVINGTGFDESDVINRKTIADHSKAKEPLSTGPMEVDGENIAKGGKVRNLFHAGSVDDLPVGNDTGFEISGAYQEAGDVCDIYYGTTHLGNIKEVMNTWVSEKIPDNTKIYKNLVRQAPLPWGKKELSPPDYINITEDAILDEPVAFTLREFNAKLVIKEGIKLTLSATADNSYVLPDVILSDLKSDILFTNPKAISSVASLAVNAMIDSKSVGVLYCNIAMPFDHSESISRIKYDGGNRAENGTVGQNNWGSTTGNDGWLFERQDTDNNFKFSTKTEALDAIRGVRYDANGSEQPTELSYSYGKSPEKSDAWKSAHWGWNVVKSPSFHQQNEKNKVFFKDQEINAVQHLTSTGGYETLVKKDGNFYLKPYTAYFVQALREDSDPNLLRSTPSQAFEAVLELVAADGTVRDCILAFAGEALPGRDVEKLGVGEANLYIDKAGMKCVASDAAGQFPVHVVGKELSLRLASVSDGASATWNGVPIAAGEIFPAVNGVLRVGNVPTSNESIGKEGLIAWGESGQIVIEGAAEGTTYQVVSGGGAKVAVGNLTSSRSVISVTAPGLYLVTVAGQNFKVMVK